MAGTVTLTSDLPLRDNEQRIIGRRIVVNATGDASNGTFPDTTLKKLRGYLQPVVTNPGSTAPTDNWDWAIKDSVDSTADASGTTGTDRDTANTEVAVATSSGSATPHFFDGGNYTLAISGNSVNSATLQIVFRWLFVQA